MNKKLKALVLNSKFLNLSIDDLKNESWYVPGIIIETCDSSGNIKDRWDI